MMIKFMTEPSETINNNVTCFRNSLLLLDKRIEEEYIKNFDWVIFFKFIAS